MSDERTPLPRPKCRRLTGFKVLGTGSYVPEKVIDNEQLHKQLGFDSDWIVKRTGILERRHAAPHQATSDLCVEAARKAMTAANVNASDIDLLVLGTFTPDMSFPSTACQVQDRLRLSCAAVEIQAACAGFIYSLATAAAYVKAGVADCALVIGGDTTSRVINPNDIKTYPLFGDGAGAFVITRGTDEEGFIGLSLGSDGGGGDLLNRPACGSRLPPTPDLINQGMHFMHMDGRAVFRWAVGILCDTITDVLNFSGYTTDQVDLFIPHQANIRIINASIDVLHIPRTKVFHNLEKYGNTSAASIPLAFDEALAEGSLKRGQLAVVSGFGAGLAWGTGLLRY